jgi:hypothetical protein
MIKGKKKKEKKQKRTRNNIAKHFGMRCKMAIQKADDNIGTF